MGCDIHELVEVKRAVSGGTYKYWRCAGELDMHRNYYVFGLLAGVRGDGPAIQSGRGVPCDNHGDPDMSEAGLAMLRAFPGDRHSHGWVTLAEMKAHAAPETIDGWGPESWGELIAKVEAIRSREGVSDEEVRLVFAFDN